MTSVYSHEPKSTQDDSQNSNPTSPSLTMPLVRDPIVLNGMEVEETISLAIRAFPALHGYQLSPFSELSSPIKDLHDLETQMSIRYQAALQTGLMYMKFFFGDMPEPPTNCLAPNVARQSMRLFLALPNNGSRTLMILDKNAGPFFLQHFSKMKHNLASGQKLVTTLSEWNPPFVTCALMFGLVFFNENARSDPLLSLMRERLLTAFDLYTLQQCKGDMESLWQSRRNLVRCLELSSHGASTILRVLRALTTKFL